MSQEYITGLVLHDARIAVWDGNPNPTKSVRQEFPLQEIDIMLEKFVRQNRRDEVRHAIINQLNLIFNWEGEPIGNFIEKKDLFDMDGNPIPGKFYYRINPKLTDTYEDENRNSFIVKGILIKAEKNVMRTDGIIVESLLGGGEALDNYSMNLQQSSIDSRKLENLKKQAEIDKLSLAMEIIRNDNRNDQADTFNKLFPCCKPSIFSLWPPKDDEENNEEPTIEGKSSV